MDQHPTQHCDKLAAKRQCSLNACCFRFMLAIFGALLLLMNASSNALASNIIIVSQTNSKLQQSIIASLQRKLPRHLFKLLNADNSVYKLIVVNKPDLVITLGYRAAYLVPKNITPLLHTVISYNDLKSISLCQLIVCEHTPRQIAIHVDQPAVRQINLIQLLFPKIKTIGTLVGSFSTKQEKTLIKTTKDCSLNLKTRKVKNNEDINNQLNELLKNTEALLPLPDPIIYNRFTIPQILLTTYHQKIPVIGFSKSFAEAGAIAAVYSTPEQISQHISEVIPLIFSDPGYRPASSHPAYFDIAINRNVARTLEVKIPPLTELRKSMIEMEK